MINETARGYRRMHKIGTFPTNGTLNSFVASLVNIFENKGYTANTMPTEDTRQANIAEMYATMEK